MPASPKDIVSNTHPLYRANLPLWTYFNDHAVGGPLYAQKTNPLFAGVINTPGDLSRSGVNRYVTKHALEDSSDYLVRISKAVCVNLCAPAIDLLVGTVGSADSLTIDLPNDYMMLLDDADLMGDSFNQLMLSARTQAATFGHTFLLCDSTKAAGEIRTEADLLNQGVRPYFRSILPEHMLSWRLDNNGKPMEVLFRIPIESSGSILDADAATSQQFEYRFWSREEWIVFRQNGDEIVEAERGTNPLHEIPICVLYHRKVVPFLGESLLKEASSYSQLLSCWLSDLDQTMTNQSFSQACLRSENAPAQVGLGTSKVLHLHPDKKDGENVTGAADFFYRSPDSAPLATMWDSFYRMIDMANGSMSLAPEATVDQSHPESGISRAWRWHSTEKRLVQMATNEQESARNLFYFAARWKGQENFDGSIVYGTSFDMGDLEGDLQALLGLQTVGLPPTAQAELRARAIRKALPNLDPKKQALIDAELQRMASMAPEVMDRLSAASQG